MTPAAIIVLAFSMSADAFAAAIGRGAAHRPSPVEAVKAGLVFGAIEATTPLVGWGLGRLAAGFVEQIDHWIAFTLLGLVGAHMIRESLAPAEPAEEESAEATPPNRSRWTLIATAIGTSIDAAAVGVGLAFIGANIWIIAAAIGLTTFACTTTGMLIGKRIGVRFGKLAERVGGVALIVLGTGILIEHLGGL